MSLLEIRNASKRFGGIQAIDRVSFSVQPGEILGMIGPNGAGKTTLFNLVTGDIALDEGSIVFAGRDITGLKPHQTCKNGISRTFQVTRPFGKMTCLENVYVPLHENQPELKGQARRQRAEELLAMTATSSTRNDLNWPGPSPPGRS